MAKKKSSTDTARSKQGVDGVDGEVIDKLASSAELKEFLENIRDRMTDGTAAPIYAVSVLNHLLSIDEIYSLLDKDSKEIARDIWLRIKQAGLQVKNPPMLFSPEEESLTAS